MVWRMAAAQKSGVESSGQLHLEWRYALTSRSRRRPPAWVPPQNGMLLTNSGLSGSNNKSRHVASADRAGKLSGKAPGRQPNKTSQGQGNEGQESRRKTGAGSLYLLPQAEEERKEAAANRQQKVRVQCLKWRWPVVKSTTPYLRGRGQRERQRS